MKTNRLVLMILAAAVAGKLFSGCVAARAEMRNEGLGTRHHQAEMLANAETNNLETRGLAGGHFFTPCVPEPICGTPFLQAAPYFPSPYGGSVNQEFSQQTAGSQLTSCTPFGPVTQWSQGQLTSHTLQGYAYGPFGYDSVDVSGHSLQYSSGICW